MSYLKTSVKAGKVEDTKVYHTARHGSKKRPRSKNANRTCESQKKINERNSLQKLIYEIHENFREEDWYLTPTYGKGIKKLLQPEELKKNINKYMRDMRTLYKKNGGVLKYIIITEYIKCRPHHHLLINNIGIRLKEVTQLWEFGFVRVNPYRGDIGDAERLANYFVKESNNTFNTEERVHGMRWVPSKNLKHPKPIKKVVPASTWRENPKPKKGYYIDSVMRGYTETNYPYMFYRMIKLPDGEEEAADFRGDE